MAPQEEEKKVSASDDMPNRPRTRSFDKGQKKMSGKDDQGNPPLTDFPLHEKTIEALLGRDYAPVSNPGFDVSKDI